MKKSEHEQFARRVLNILGNKKIKQLHKLQEQSLDNQLQDLVEEHNNLIETITDDEIMGRYKLVTQHIYPDDFVKMSDLINR